ncbi:Transcriptional regulatory protein CseB [Streptomyces sp. YIM 121038]|uniref:response regulator transcription factor n=1 Tax=Streptomyces sp. YIM 121038 TaxID=2136401 RepID=UPI001110A0A9|nr:response regulator transcription factor [Streptomyces sp. YIM 121038]QCX80476.1 Transcriptional regulatory protein CseB [Streptomyces sp. YIM 121038]
MGKPSTRVLLVSNDARLSTALHHPPLPAKYFVISVPTGAQALENFGDFDLLLLDSSTPGMDSHEVCKRIRNQASVPIIIVGACANEIDRVLALNAGADYCVVKSDSLHELQASMDAVMRRSSSCPVGQNAPGPSAPAGEMLVAGPLRLNPRNRDVTLDGRPVRLTPKEFDLLAMLMEDPDTLHTRKAIIARVWNEHWFGSTRTLDVHIGALRQKLGSYEWIETKRGIGFRLGSVPSAGARDSP